MGMCLMSLAQCILRSLVSCGTPLASDTCNFERCFTRNVDGRELEAPRAEHGGLGYKR